MSRRFLGPVLKIAVSAALLAVVARRMDWGEAAAALARLRPATLALCLGLAMIGYVGRAVRWTYLLRQGGVVVSNADSYRLTLVGIFYGLVTPGRVGELGRALHLGLPASRTMPSVLWDRLTDVLLLELMSVPAFLALDAWRGPLLWIYLAVVLATIALVAALDSPAVFALAGRTFPGAAQRLATWGGGSTGMLRTAAFGRGALAGLFFYAANFVAAFILLKNLVPGSSPLLILVFPVIILLGNLPIAFGGLGLREQVAAVAFAGFGAPRAVGPVFSLLWFGYITLVPAAIGLFLMNTRWGRGTAHLIEAEPTTESGR
jgi:hypothetical protein